MKKKKHINIFLRQKALIRKKRRANKIKKSKKYSRTHTIVYQETTPKFKKNKSFYAKVVTKTAPEVFCLLSNPESTINYIQSLSKYLKNNSNITIKIDLGLVKKIDAGAICILLAKIHEVSKKENIKFFGTFPIDSECYQEFIESGITDHISNLSGGQIVTKSKNLLIKIGQDRTLNEVVGQKIKLAVEHITGKKENFPPVFSVIQEICSNSVEHAYLNESKHWFLGIYFKTNESHQNYVIFMLTDLGIGALKTLNRKHSSIIKETMINKKNHEIMKRAFERKYMSATGESNRNRGLPLILKRFNYKYISNLKLYTNDVYIDFANNSMSRNIHTNFKGTLYTWEININNIEQWTTQKQ